MSHYRAVRSHGSPYFAFAATPDLDASALPGQGMFSLTVEFDIHSLPQQLASADECHPLIAFGDYLKVAPAGNVLALGVSPSGRLVWTTQGNTLMSSAGTLSANSGWHSATGSYDKFLSTSAIVLDGFQVASGASGTAQPALPTRYGRLYLFNGTNAISNFSASIRLASTVFTIVGGDNPSISYAIDERSGDTLKAVLASTPGAPGGGYWALHPNSALNWDMNAGWLDPLLYPTPWGPLPVADPRSAFNWEVITDYTKREMPTTFYTKTVGNS